MSGGETNWNSLSSSSYLALYLLCVLRIKNHYIQRILFPRNVWCNIQYTEAQHSKFKSPFILLGFTASLCEFLILKEYLHSASSQRGRTIQLRPNPWYKRHSVTQICSRDHYYHTRQLTSPLVIFYYLLCFLEWCKHLELHRMITKLCKYKLQILLCYGLSYVMVLLVFQLL